MKTHGTPGLYGQLAMMMTAMMMMWQMMMMMMMISSAQELLDSVVGLRESRALDSCDQSSNQWRQWGPWNCRSHVGDLSTCHESKRGPQAAHVPAIDNNAHIFPPTQPNCGMMKSCVKTRTPRIILQCSRHSNPAHRREQVQAQGPSIQLHFKVWSGIICHQNLQTCSDIEGYQFGFVLIDSNIYVSLKNIIFCTIFFVFSWQKPAILHLAKSHSVATQLVWGIKTWRLFLSSPYRLSLVCALTKGRGTRPLFKFMM